MVVAMHHRFSSLHGTRLPGWITLSVLVHLLLVLSAGGGNAPRPAPYRQPLLTVDISHIAPELPAPVVVPQLEPEIESQRSAPELPPPDPPRDANRDSQPVAAVERPVPFGTYFNVHELDVRAEPINDVLLRYPWVEYQQRLGGMVRFTLFINAQGGLDRIDMIEATPPGHFEEAALEAVSKLQFTPALKNGRPVKSQKTIDVVFDPSENLSKPAANRPESSAAEK